MYDFIQLLVAVLECDWLSGVSIVLTWSGKFHCLYHSDCPCVHIMH